MNQKKIDDLRKAMRGSGNIEFPLDSPFWLSTKYFGSDGKGKIKVDDILEIRNVKKKKEFKRSIFQKKKII